MNRQVGKAEAEDLKCMDLEIKILEKPLFKGHVRNLFAISMERNQWLNRMAV